MTSSIFSSIYSLVLQFISQLKMFKKLIHQSFGITRKKYVLKLVFIFVTFISHSQQDSIRIETMATMDNGSNFNVKMDLLYPFEKFSSLGLTIPPFTNWSVGFPLTRFEQSFYLYTQKRKNLCWYRRLTIPFVTYNLATIDVEDFILPAEIYVTGTYFFKPTFREARKSKKFILGSRKGGDFSTNIYVKSKLPKKFRRGLNFGYFVSNQHTANGHPLLHHGLVLGYSQRKELTIKSQLQNQSSLYEDWRPAFRRLDRTFYANLTFSVYQNYWANPNGDWGSLPLGAYTGWLFLNKNNDRIGFTAWNLELGIKGPVIYKLPTYGDDPYLLLYFTFRGYVGGMFKK